MQWEEMVWAAMPTCRRCDGLRPQSWKELAGKGEWACGVGLPFLCPAQVPCEVSLWFMCPAGLAGTLPPAHSTCSLHPGLGVSRFQEHPSYDSL